jgi:molybdopterin molybdotransferase
MEDLMARDLNSIEDVLKTIEHAFSSFIGKTEYVGIHDAYGRYLAHDIISQEEVPAFPKSTVDGYAIKFIKKPSRLKLQGKVAMGSSAQWVLNEGECIYVPTGGMLPIGTQSMVMIEDTELLGVDVMIHKSVESRDNIIEIGTDMSIGKRVLEQGRRIKSHELGALAALGIFLVPVFVKPKVFLITTGDELVVGDSPLTLGQIRESNSFALMGISAELGLNIIKSVHVTDDYSELKATVYMGIEESDILIITGGSSVGEKDYTYSLLSEICDGNLLVNGMAIKPGKPTLIGKHKDKPVIGLPGHPVSAIVVYRLLIESLLKKWGFNLEPKQSKPAKLTRTVYGANGRDTYQMVTLSESEEGLIAVPTSGKSGMITLLTQSNGYIIIPKEIKCYERDTIVEGYYF